MNLNSKEQEAIKNILINEYSQSIVNREKVRNVIKNLNIDTITYGDSEWFKNDKNIIKSDNYIDSVRVFVIGFKEVYYDDVIRYDFMISSSLNNEKIIKISSKVG